MPRGNRCMYMAHVSCYVCCSDCVVVCGNVCCVAAVVGVGHIESEVATSLLGYLQV